MSVRESLEKQKKWLQGGETSRAKEAFEQIRSQGKSRFSLRLRLTIVVSAELAVCIAIAYGLAALLDAHVPAVANLPMVVDLLLVSLVVGSLATSFLAKWFFSPIKRLRLAMEQIADGDYSVRLQTKSTSKEIQEVYTGFNMMAQELSATEMLQKDFVANVSHEFKTPITAVEGYATLLQGCGGLTGEETEYVGKILFNTRRLSELVGDILLLSKIENQSIETNRVRYRLDEQIRQSILGLETMWTEKEIEFDVELGSVIHCGNQGLMAHVWDNLISNAVKFSPRGGLVRIRLEEREGQIVFTIDDEGPGIPPEAMKHIFDKFYQADTARQQEGHGLGLALVRRILAMTGGEVSAENLPGGGSRFTVTLSE